MFAVLLFLVLGAAAAVIVVVSGLSARLRQLEARIRALEQDVSSGERPTPAAVAPEPVTPAPTPPPGPEVRHYVPPPRQTLEPSPPPPAPAVVAAESAEPEPGLASLKPAPRWSQLETRLGGAGLNRIGVIILLLGIGFFLKYAFDNQWIGPTGRVAIGLLAGVVFLVLGDRLQRAAYRIPAQGLVALGIGSLYLSVYAAHGFYALVPQFTAFALLVLVTATGMALAIHHDARAIAMLASLGGFLTPALLSTGVDQAGTLFTYLAVLDAGILASAYWRGWRELHLLSFALTQAYFWAWHDQWYRPERLGVALVGATVFFILFALVAPLEAAARRTTRGWRAAPLLVFAAPTAYFLAARAVLYPAHRTWLGLLCLVLATGYLAGGRWAVNLDRPLALYHVAIALSFLTLSFPAQFTEHGVTIAWSVQGLALLWGGFRLGIPRLRAAALVVLLLAGLRWLTLIEPRARYDGLLILGHPALLPSLAFVAACGLAAALYATRERDLSSRETTAPPLLVLAAVGVTAGFLTDALREHSLLGPFPRDLAVLTTVIWTAAAVPVLALAPRDRTRILSHAAWMLLAAVGVAALLDATMWRTASPVVFNLRFASALLIVMLYGVFAGMVGDLPIATAANRTRLRAIAAGAAALFLLWNLSAEIVLMSLPGVRRVEADKARNMGLSVLWTVYAFVALGLGIWRDQATLRVGAIALFGLTVIKVFLIDLAALDAAYRILSFLVLGALLVLASFLYSGVTSPRRSR